MTTRSSGIKLPGLVAGIKREFAPMDTPTPTNTFDKLPSEKRQRVLEESLQEFAEHGYHQASINRIVGRLGIAKGSVFQYFGSKEGLFKHLFKSALDQIKAPLRAIRDAEEPKDFGARLRLIFSTSAAFARSHALIWRLYRRLIHQEDFPLRGMLLGEVRAEALTFFREVVEAAQKRGEVRLDLDPQAAAFVIESCLDRALAAQDQPLLDADFGLSSSNEALRQARLDALVDILRQGLQTAPTQGDRPHD
jgi:AcrR family transcriptional regulator